MIENFKFNRFANKPGGNVPASDGAQFGNIPVSVVLADMYYQIWQ